MFLNKAAYCDNIYMKSFVKEMLICLQKRKVD